MSWGWMTDELADIIIAEARRAYYQEMAKRDGMYYVRRSSPSAWRMTPAIRSYLTAVYESRLFAETREKRGWA